MKRTIRINLNWQRLAVSFSNIMCFLIATHLEMCLLNVMVAITFCGSFDYMTMSKIDR